MRNVFQKSSGGYSEHSSLQVGMVRVLISEDSAIVTSDHHSPAERFKYVCTENFKVGTIWLDVTIQAE